MFFSLPKLPYAYDALEPYFDAKTMEIHHTKHHQTYVDKLNAALEGQPQLINTTIESLIRQIATLPQEIKTPVTNHGGGHYNHSFFWENLAPNPPDSPTGTLAAAITQTFGSLDTFKTQFNEAAATHFGSGWVWLTATPSTNTNHSSLTITTTPNQNSPLMDNKIPLLALDLWEHAYYLKYQNRRPEYIDAFWHLINWPVVEKRYQSL